ncbi:hypothetical protein TNCV_1311481 [Trichonephila clavipes]|nr:hypothetical protein TNCV_1311481 [Trichonephila clavipes]
MKFRGWLWNQFLTVLDLIIIRKLSSLQGFLEWTEDMVYTRREFRAVRGNVLESSRGITLTIFGTSQPQEDKHYHINDNPAEQHATSVALDILSQFMECGTVRGSIDNRPFWRPL